jgi:hypothetical protein
LVVKKLSEWPAFVPKIGIVMGLLTASFAEVEFDRLQSQRGLTRNTLEAYSRGLANRGRADGQP